MKAVIQRVKEAKVEVDNKIVGQIAAGMLVFLGVGKKDSKETANTFVHKLIQLRIFEDDNGKMNIAGIDCGAQFLIVPQFTIYGNCNKGRRPSFDAAAPPRQAEDIYEYFVNQMRNTGLKVETGQFAAMMDVSLVNDGPVTFIVEQ